MTDFWISFATGAAGGATVLGMLGGILYLLFKIDDHKRQKMMWGEKSSRQ